MPSYAAKNSKSLSLNMETMSSKTEKSFGFKFFKVNKGQLYHVSFDIALIFIKRWESILEPTCICIGLEPTLLKYH